MSPRQIEQSSAVQCSAAHFFMKSHRAGILCADNYTIVAVLIPTTPNTRTYVRMEMSI